MAIAAVDWLVDPALEPIWTVVPVSVSHFNVPVLQNTKLEVDTPLFKRVVLGIIVHPTSYVVELYDNIMFDPTVFLMGLT